MRNTRKALSEEATTLLEKLTSDERDDVLFRLVSDKLDAQNPAASIPVHRPDGTLLEYIRPPSPRSPDEEVLMHERATRVNPAAGRPTPELLQRMRAGDVESVKRFIFTPWRAVGAGWRSGAGGVRR
jgi:hypothetical protein